MENKIIIIGGQTAIGKTDLAIKLAKEFNGEIISADSRQVYVGMDIGTGKDIERSKKQVVSSKKINRKFQLVPYEVKGIKIWLYDVVKPDYQFNVGEYRILANRVIGDIISRGKTPIVVGGTGLYLRSLTDSLLNITVSPNEKLRASLLNASVSQLQDKLKEVWPEKYSQLNNSDKNNPRRLIRAIEIAIWKNLPQPPQFPQLPQFSHLVFILHLPEAKLVQRISKRITQRLKEGMVEEVKTLLKKGYNFNLPSFSATGYKEITKYLEGKITKEQATEEWLRQEVNYAKKQLTWFKKFYPAGKRIFWFDSQDPHSYTKVRNLLCRFLKKPSF